MANYKSASNAATSALTSIPFENILGGPLEACIRAQQKAAQTTVDFIHSVGLQEVDITNEKGEVVDSRIEAIYVSFQFIQNGRMVQLNVPLLSLVPIPYIAISTIDINFKANITAATVDTKERNTSFETSEEETGKRNSYSYSRTKSKNYRNWNGTSKTSDFKAQVSSKKDSKATQESKYSVEYTMDIAVHASQDSMPAGMAKVLEMIGTAMDLCSADGELSVSGTYFEVEDGGKAFVEASYKLPTGLIDNTKLVLEVFNEEKKDNNGWEAAEIEPGKGKDAYAYELPKGVYKIYPADNVELAQTVEVKKIPAQTVEVKKISEG